MIFKPDLPPLVRIGPFDIAIIIWSLHEASGARQWGQFSSAEMCIRVQEEFPSAIKAVDTLMHEIMHAIFWAYDILNDGDKEERVVRQLGTAITALHRDNPWLAHWITKTLASQ